MSQTTVSLDMAACELKTNYLVNLMRECKECVKAKCTV